MELKYPVKLLNMKSKPTSNVLDGASLRKRLVSVALLWQKEMGVAPAITPAIAEYDAARLVGCDYKGYCQDGLGKSAVRKGFDFRFRGKRFQVKANRPAQDTAACKVTKIGKPKNYDWDVLIWVLYNSKWEIVEAWMWGRRAFRNRYKEKDHIRPKHLKQSPGQKIFPKPDSGNV